MAENGRDARRSSRDREAIQVGKKGESSLSHEDSGHHELDGMTFLPDSLDVERNLMTRFLSTSPPLSIDWMQKMEIKKKKKEKKEKTEI